MTKTQTINYLQDNRSQEDKHPHEIARNETF